MASKKEGGRRNPAPDTGCAFPKPLPIGRPAHLCARRRTFCFGKAGHTRDVADGSNDGSNEEVERYKQAANDALQLVDWCIGYLVGIRKGSIATTLAKNRAYIRGQLMGEAEEPVPTTDG